MQQLARMAARGRFRSVEIVLTASVASRGPQLWCASHFGAFSDPIVLLHALERQPRFLAADGLFRVPVLRSLLRLVAAIPVRRTQDGGGAANTAMFAASHDALVAGDALVIFPEGVATEGAAVSPLRTGAARIALGARAAGAAGPQLVAVGIHYQNRAALRQRVFVDVGEPLDLGTRLEASGRDPATASDADHAAVRALTAELGRRPAPDRAALVAAVEAYRAALDAVGLSDAEVYRPGSRSRRRLLATG